MSWLNLNQSLNSLKGQITSFATEVLSEGNPLESGDEIPAEGSSSKTLEEKCRNQELEIKALKKLTDELEASLSAERLAKKNGVKEEESSWYWDPPPDQSKSRPPDLDMEDQYRATIRQLQDELSSIKEQAGSCVNTDAEEELQRLREENKNLTKNLDDLDNQHQMAMDRLLLLKTELQKNFEILREEHEDLKNANENNAFENKELLIRLEEKEKEIDDLRSEKSDFDTLSHKYQNLERVYSLMRENAEKFQEENQELHEEVFRLQEQVTKLEHDLEILSKRSEQSNVVPKENYEKLVQELDDLRNSRKTSTIHTDEVNIDDNAKSVIENLKRDINELRHQLSQKDESNLDIHNQSIKSDKIMQLYNKYVNFELPIDFVGEIPTAGDIILYKLESVFKTVNSFKKEIDALQHNISEKNLNMNHLQTQIDDLTTENDFLTTDIQHFERELNEMKKNNDFLINEIAALKNSSKLQPIIETHEDNLAKLETELADCNNQNKTFESEIKRIEIELAKVRSEKILVQESLKDLKDKYTLMLEELEMFKTQSKAVEELESDVHNECAEKYTKSLHEIEDLKKRLNSANAKNEQLSIDLHIVENDKVLLTKDIDDLKHTVIDKTKITEQLESTNATLQQKLQENEDKIEAIIKSGIVVENVKSKLEAQIAQLERELTNQSNNKSDAELDKLLTEKLLLSERLEQSISEKAALKDKLENLTAEFLQLLTRENQLVGKIDSLQLENSSIASLNKTIESLKNQLLDKEELEAEVEKQRQNVKDHMEKKLLLEGELNNTDKKIAHLQNEFEKVYAEIAIKDSLIDDLNANITQNTEKISILTQNVIDLETTIKIKNTEIEMLREDLATHNENLNQNQCIINSENEENNKDILRMSEDLNAKTAEVLKYQSLIEENQKTYNDLIIKIDAKDEEIKNLKQTIVELTEKNNVKAVHEQESLQSHQIDVKKVEECQANLTVKEQQLEDLIKKAEQLETTCKGYKDALDASNKEKTELINLVTLKHNESLKYHNEIQRLNVILLEQANEFKKVIEEKDKVNENNINNCTECEKLRKTLNEKDNLLVNHNISNEVTDKLKQELENSSLIIKNLTEKVDTLESNLTNQLDIVKRLTAENLQLSEKEQSRMKELERLRHHLMETQESHTRELMATEQKMTECQAALHRLEERAKHNTTVYTSNSIRANQEVETLRNQIKLLEKQREEAQSKLSEAEDGRSRSEAALTNLQVVLEQFQLDKEREIDAATEKIRNKMEDIKLHNQELKDKIVALNKKLDESIAGLQAATRLGDQVETKTAQINDLKEQVKALQSSVAAAEERYYNAISNQQDKVDKNLVKNLVINYVITASNNNTDKSQVLRILSTVLDFNQQECSRLGLSRTAPDSLAAEFIKFLQAESRPRPQATPQMTTSQLTTPQSSRRSSTMGPSPMEQQNHKRNPSTGSNNLLFQNIDKAETSSQISIESETRHHTLDTGVNQTRNTEGAILKHVLKDM